MHTGLAWQSDKGTHMPGKQKRMPRERTLMVHLMEENPCYYAESAE
jgi:hypothetical protein